MRNGWQRTLAVGGASLALVGAPIIGVPALASAAVTAPDPVTPTSAPAAPTSAPLAPMPAADVTPAAPVAPVAAAGATNRKPRGCSDVTPKKPWRLVATRPDPTASAVDITWSPVGCTTGYRVTIVGTGVDRSLDIAGGTTGTVAVPDLSPTLSYTITVTSVGAAGDGGVSGAFRLHRSGQSTESELTIDFPDAGPTDPTVVSDAGASPWINPKLSWTAPTGAAPKSYRVKVTGSGGGTVVEDTVAGTETSTRLGNAISAGVPYTVTLTPVMADGTDGDASRLTFGDQKAPRPEQVTGIAPVVQFSPVTDVEKGRVLGYEIAFGAGLASKHLFVSAPAPTGSTAPWVALDPSFAAVDSSETAVPMAKMVAIVRTITTMGRSAWTSGRTIEHSDVATSDASYFAGIGHVGGDETVPRNGFLKVHGASADLQVTDLVWSQSHREQAVAVTVSVYGPSGSLAFTQDVPLTHLREATQDAWRASDIPLPDGWTSIVLRRGGADVATWVNTGGKPCVAAVTYADAATDLPEMWKDSWCPA